MKDYTDTGIIRQHNKNKLKLQEVEVFTDQNLQKLSNFLKNKVKREKKFAKTNGKKCKVEYRKINYNFFN